MTLHSAGFLHSWGTSRSPDTPTFCSSNSPHGKSRKQNGSKMRKALLTHSSQQVACSLNKTRDWPRVIHHGWRCGREAAFLSSIRFFTSEFSSLPSHIFKLLDVGWTFLSDCVSTNKNARLVSKSPLSSDSHPNHTRIAFLTTRLKKTELYSKSCPRHGIAG